ncbi:MAG TPA: UDP-N-acetylmuramate--L-alanine ligase [Bacteroidales bacterium]|nr:UDP-N-acetylmuramate--L-alanine ligase [Bacteroidales bacterium]HPT02754.1 UDP-N-acetylmuramate--L-alanine ligase [Bacteroidales bacterium]
MDIRKVESVYFLGIGGIGMSALARYFRSLGKTVAGYDRTRSLLTSALEKEGISVHYEADTSLIEPGVDLAIYTPAVKRDHPDYDFFEKAGIPMFKRAEILGFIADQYKTIAIAGTHGKTTTTTLTAHILTQSQVKCQAFLGGISRNYDSNLLLAPGSSYLVAEADEFDRSFLHLHPHIAVITSMDADHLDIYGNLASMIESFAAYAGNIRNGGMLILKKGLNLPLQAREKVAVLRYSSGEPCDYYPDNIRLEKGLYEFDLHHPSGVIHDLILGIPGWYNIENAVAASACALLNGVTENELRAALNSFRGVERRFDIRLQESGLVYLDDYGHHPEELKACITSARQMFPGRKITGIFQPHLYTRTRDFADDFARQLSLLDEVILLPVYPAREEPIPGINAEMLLGKITAGKKKLVQKSELPACLDGSSLEVLITMGAGDIDRLVLPIENYLRGFIQNRNNQEARL